MRTVFMAGAAGLLMLVPVHAETLNELAREASCIVTESEVVDLSSADAGTLASVAVEVGQTVKAGEPVAQLESSLEQATFRIAKARAEDDTAVRARQQELAAARDTFSRKEKLLARQVAAKATVEEARTEVALAGVALEKAAFERHVAELELERTRAALSRRTILSPIDGVVTEVSRRAGEYVDAQNPVMTIAEVSTLIAEIYLPKQAYPLVKVGLLATIVPEAPIGGTRKAVVETRSPVIDAASGLFRVTFRFDNSDGEVPAGIRCKLHFDN